MSNLVNTAKKGRKPTLPKLIYRVTKSGGKSGYNVTGGGSFHSLADAQARQARLIREGAESDIYVSDLHWLKVQP